MTVYVYMQASRFGLTTSDNVWILPYYRDPKWWELKGNLSLENNCSNHEMADILTSALFGGPYKWPRLASHVSYLHVHDYNYM